jgi:hypothetical protein
MTAITIIANVNAIEGVMFLTPSDGLLDPNGALPEPLRATPGNQVRCLTILTPHAACGGGTRRQIEGGVHPSGAVYPALAQYSQHTPPELFAKMDLLSDDERQARKSSIIRFYLFYGTFQYITLPLRRKGKECQIVRPP